MKPVTFTDERSGLSVTIDPTAVYYVFSSNYRQKVFLPITAPGAAEIVTVLTGPALEDEWSKNGGPFRTLVPSGMQIEVETGAKILQLLKQGQKVLDEKQKELGDVEF